MATRRRPGTRSAPKPRRSRAAGARRLLWVTDPWDTLDHARDTTLRWAEECLVEGVTTHWCDVRSIRWQDGGVRLDARAIEGIYPGRARDAFRLGPVETLAPADFPSIHYRTDPPVDLAYLHPLQLLVLGLGNDLRAARGRIVNPPEMLLGANEKTEAFRLDGLSPPTCVATAWEALAAFGRHEGRAVLKPLHEAQSKGVALLDFRTPDTEAAARAALASTSEGFTRPVLLQRFLPGIAAGETRLWFLDGKLLAFARKLPAQGDFRVNIDGGSRLAPTELGTAERKAAGRIARHLARAGVRLAAVDLIEALVTDFNFTSPGLITQMEGVLGVNLARPIVRALLR